MLALIYLFIVFFLHLCSAINSELITLWFSVYKCGNRKGFSVLNLYKTPLLCQESRLTCNLFNFLQFFWASSLLDIYFFFFLIDTGRNWSSYVGGSYIRIQLKQPTYVGSVYSAHTFFFFFNERNGFQDLIIYKLCMPCQF